MDQSSMNGEMEQDEDRSSTSKLENVPTTPSLPPSETADVEAAAIPNIPKSAKETKPPADVKAAVTRKSKKGAIVDDEDEPLIDTTTAIPLHSKKTERLQKRLEKKAKNPKKPKAQKATFLDLPAELLHEIFSHLRPSDLFTLQRLDKSTQEFIKEHETTLAKDLISSRYWALSKCFPLPVAFEDVDSSAHPALLSDSRQAMLAIHKKPYQHVLGIDPQRICTCMTCVFAWNNLCLIVDLAHWQKNLNNREPIPMIPRGRQPEWNQELLERNASIVYKAMQNPLVYAAILEKHLNTTTGTIMRRSKWMKKPVTPEKRLYHLSQEDATRETDEYLQRSGPPSYEYPFHRDNYYGLDAYVPNRKWSKEEQKWKYYHVAQHQRDLDWVKERFTPKEKVKDELNDFVEQFKSQIAT